MTFTKTASPHPGIEHTTSPKVIYQPFTKISCPLLRWLMYKRLRAPNHNGAPNGNQLLAYPLLHHTGNWPSLCVVWSSVFLSLGSWFPRSCGCSCMVVHTLASHAWHTGPHPEDNSWKVHSFLEIFFDLMWKSEGGLVLSFSLSVWMVSLRCYYERVG